MRIISVENVWLFALDKSTKSKTKKKKKKKKKDNP